MPLDGRERGDCNLCGNRGFVEMPLAEPGDPQPPPSPRRVRAFIYGCAAALPDIEQGRRRTRGDHDPRKP